MKDTVTILSEHVHNTAELHKSFFQNYSSLLSETALCIARCLVNGGKIMFCGNGGDAALAQYLAALFVHKCDIDRPSLPAISLSADMASVTAIGNSLGFEHVFARQVEAFGCPEDVLLGISSQQECTNVQLALLTARCKGLATASLGREGCSLTSCCDIAVNAPDVDALLVRELHLAVGHMLCRLTDYYLFENVTELDA